MAIIQSLLNQPQISLYLDDQNLKVCYLDGGFKYLDLDLSKIDSYRTDWMDFCQKFDGKCFVYDLKSLYKKLVDCDLILPKNTLDIQLAGFLANSTESIDLKYQIEHVLKEIEIDLSPALLKLGQYYLQNLPPQIDFLWQSVESPLAKVLAKMELKGVYVDKQRLEQIGAELLNESNALEGQTLSQMDLPNLNLNSPKQLGQALALKGFNPRKSTAGGQISTDRESLEILLGTDETGLVEKILDYRTVTKLHSTYTQNLINMLDSNNRIHTNYNQAAVATGRISSNSPNLQNIPIRHPKYGPLLRSCFAAPQSRCLISADYSQVELRILAHFSQDPTLLDAFNQKQDIHARTASEIFEIPIDQITKDQRRIGKTLNFALVYQQGAFSTAKQLGIEQKQATEFIKKYFSRFSKVKPLVELVLQEAAKNGYVETLFGRRRYFDNLTSGNAALRKLDERAAFNAVLQGTNADIIKMAMLKIANSYLESGIDGQLILQVHDELVVEVDEQQTDLASKILINEMLLNQPLDNVLLEVEAGIGHNWADSK